nr:4'-phosphopantetheinyl transferase superfamily protein [Sphingomonas populi]
MPRRRSSAAPERVAVADLYFGSLDVAEDELERLAKLLDPAERARAARFAFARDRRRFIVRRARLRETLAMATGAAAERLVYTENAYGKPALAGGPKFSASHSHELWVVAVSDRELGVDLEYHQPEIDWRDLAAGLFGAGECAALDALAEDDAIRGFFDCWARKEAFVKAIGMGLSYPLDAFAVSVTPEARLLAGAEGWRIAGFALAEGYSGALVIADDGAPVRIATPPHRSP